MQDTIYIIQWWFVFFIIGLIFLPITSTVFQKFNDKGYLFSKVLGLGLISYFSFILNTFRIFPFNLITILLVIWVFLLLNLRLSNRVKFLEIKSRWKIFLFEEMLFLAGVAFWSYIRAHEPSINGLEKFMDFGFINSILRSSYMPPTDMWFPPLPINYYYFGHYVTAVLTKLSMLPSAITYNLMLATIFSFTFGLSFSLLANFISKTSFTRKGVIGGILGGVIVSFGGNLHTIYSLFAAYNTDSPVPFWKLVFLPFSFPNSYWYPNATRFIPFTIHEFPLYSFVVSDLHGHVVDIIYVLLTLGLVYILFIKEGISKILLILISLFLAIMYMTNAWDGIIYLVLVSLAILLKNFNLLHFQKKGKSKNLLSFRILSNVRNSGKFFSSSIKSIVILIILFFLFSLPFSLNFKPFASGIGVLCAPSFLTNIGKLGPFLFEANHCQRSAWWQILILYGFFYFFVISFILFIARRKREIKLLGEDLFILLLILISTILISIPEFIYLKDIYPAHYRANTMFKLVYQSFMMLSISSGYIIVRIISGLKFQRRFNWKLVVFVCIGSIGLFLVGIYPYFAIKSYYGDLKTYSGLDGTVYLKNKYPQDYEAILWINKNIKGNPVIVEAQGDSYTDYARISANTGLPTILGWTVHEWLWRGSYDIPSPRIEDVKLIYESEALVETKKILKKYKAEYVYLGNLERQKYPNLFETKFEQLGNIVFKSGDTKIYKIN